MADNPSSKTTRTHCALSLPSILSIDHQRHLRPRLDYYFLQPAHEYVKLLTSARCVTITHHTSTLEAFTACITTLHPPQCHYPTSITRTIWNHPLRFNEHRHAFATGTREVGALLLVSINMDDFQAGFQRRGKPASQQSHPPQYQNRA